MDSEVANRMSPSDMEHKKVSVPELNVFLAEYPRKKSDADAS